MPSKEDRERRRAERLAAERAEAVAARRRLIVGYVVAGALTLAVVVGLVVVIANSGSSGSAEVENLPANAHIQTAAGSVNGVKPDARVGTQPPPLEQGDLQTAAQEAGCELQLDLPDEGNNHISEDDPEPDYKTNPATSGDHIEPPLQQADGAWAEPIDPKYWVHSMEHGRIVIHYSPDLPEKDQLALKGVFDEDPPGMLLIPNPDMPYQVAVTGWTQLMGCDDYEGRATLDAIRDFRDIYRGRGPEPVQIDLGQ
jgi:hypothetical protein